MTALSIALGFVALLAWDAWRRGLAARRDVLDGETFSRVEQALDKARSADATASTAAADLTALAKRVEAIEMRESMGKLGKR